MEDNTHKQLAEFIKNNGDLAGTASLFGGLHEDHAALKLFVNYIYDNTENVGGISYDVNSRNFIEYLKAEFPGETEGELNSTIKPIVEELEYLKGKGLIVDEISEPAKNTLRNFGLILMDLGLGIEPENTATLYEAALSKAYQDFPDLGANVPEGRAENPQEQAAKEPETAQVNPELASSESSEAGKTAEQVKGEEVKEQASGSDSDASSESSSTEVDSDETSSSSFFQATGQPAETEPKPLKKQEPKQAQSVQQDETAGEILPGENEALPQSKNYLPPDREKQSPGMDVANLSQLVEIPNEDDKSKKLAALLPIMEELMRKGDLPILPPSTQQNQNAKTGAFVKPKSADTKQKSTKSRRRKKVARKMMADGKEMRVRINAPTGNNLSRDLQQRSKSQLSPEEESRSRSGLFSQQKESVAANSASPRKKKRSFAKGASVAAAIATVTATASGGSAEAASHNIVKLILSFLF